MRPRPSLVWFRGDLRLSDNPALEAATRTGGPVIPVFVWTLEDESPWAPGAASRWWLHHSLKALAADLKRCGSRLVLRMGAPVQELSELAEVAGAAAVYWNRRYEPAARRQEEAVEAALRRKGIAVHVFPGNLLFEPERILNSSGQPYRVFTPFWRACRAGAEPPLPVGAPGRMSRPSRWPASARLDELQLEPRFDWAAGLRETWSPGERSAQGRWREFLRNTLSEYPALRDRPAAAGTSRLSPHLHFGEISSRQMWYGVDGLLRRTRSSKVRRAGECFLRQLVWREFAYHLQHHFPQTVDRPLRPEFARFPWRGNKAHLQAWQRGLTGYPIVDAGMRQLWVSGWMHNRVRMIVASFLVKHLLLPWQEGARWFWDTLVDADLANNTLGWQWVAGCGADAAPYFRIFNPVLQGEKFDPRGDYVRRWAPELGKLPSKWIHRPWAAPAGVLTTAGVQLGVNYPRPIVDHGEARKRALQAFAEMRSG